MDKDQILIWKDQKFKRMNEIQLITVEFRLEWLQLSLK